MLRRILVASVVSVVLMTVFFGFAYPVLMTGFAAVAFPSQAQGSLIHYRGQVVGSALAAQDFASPAAFHERPSATSPAYNAAGTTFSNLGPTNPALAKLVKQNADAVLKLEKPYNPGIDPEISLAYAQLQAHRVAAVRHLPLATVQNLITQNTEGRWLGLFGEPGVNVLELNLALVKLGGK
jgi:potassium-transporting ATPase KdpC subunit